jgi:hypothetical protein
VSFWGFRQYYFDIYCHHTKLIVCFLSLWFFFAASDPCKEYTSFRGCSSSTSRSSMSTSFHVQLGSRELNDEISIMPFWSHNTLSSHNISYSIDSPDTRLSHLPSCSCFIRYSSFGIVTSYLRCMQA